VRDIRVGNISNLSGAPFRSLKELPFVSYEEGFSSENARKLQEGELDLALIPVNIFAASGALVGLDFGVSAEPDSKILTLVSHRPVEELDTIYVYYDASASILFTKLLLQKVWNSKARLIQTRDVFSSVRLGEREGIILRRPHIKEDHKSLPVQHNLMQVWSGLTGQPFVFLIWAANPGVLDADELRTIHDALYRSANAYQKKLKLTSESLQDEIYDDHIRYYLSAREVAALNTALKEGYHSGLLPNSTYRSARITLLARNPSNTSPSRSINFLLSEVVQGKRLGLRDSLLLATDASTPDLALAARQMVQRSSECTSTSQSQLIPDCTADKLQEVVSSPFSKTEKGKIVVLPATDSLAHLSYWEDALLLASRSGACLGGFSARDILILASNEGVHVRTVLCRLKAAGLSSLSAKGGGMLVDGANSDGDSGRWFGSEWIRVMNWAHRYGLETECMLELNPSHTWKTRLLHLQKLWQLQSVNPGFKVFYLQNLMGPEISPEERLRALCICRLFLNNIPNVQEICGEEFTLTQLISLSVAANHCTLQNLEVDSQIESSFLDWSENKGIVSLVGKSKDYVH